MTSCDLRSEIQLRLVCVVGAAAQLQVLDGRGTSVRERPEVMKLEEAGLGAAAVRADECAAARITMPDGASHIRRHVT